MSKSGLKFVAPGAGALIGKKLNDDVQVNAPKGIITYKITKIS